VATHAIARELIASAARDLDGFMTEHGAYAADVSTCISQGIASLPSDVQQTVLLDVSVQNFAA
jgi:hypothetical protein